MKFEPVRLYSVAVAVLAVVAYYVPSIPTVLYLGVVAALLGLGQAVRAKVTPNSRVALNVNDIPNGGDIIIYEPELDHE